jgi:hypothetical protein
MKTFSYLEMTRARPTTAAPATTLRLFWAVTLAPVTTLRLVMALTLAPATVATARRMVRLYWMLKIWSMLPPRRRVLILILQYGRSIGTLRSSGLELYTVERIWDDWDGISVSLVLSWTQSRTLGRVLDHCNLNRDVLCNTSYVPRCFARCSGFQRPLQKYLTRPPAPSGLIDRVNLYGLML